MTEPVTLHSASFRDPNGFIFERDGVLYRQINRAYLPNYRHLMDSGLYAALTKAGRMVTHQEVDAAPADPGAAALVIRPEVLPFISYPYEWSFSQLKDAALLTLSIQQQAVEAGMTLKDASAYNIQLLGGRPILIDTLSFETYQSGQPWVAYRQFCQHFLAPLALMALVDVRLGQLLRVHIDGIPLDLAAALLPGKTRFNLGLATHIHMHASAQKKYAGQAAPVKTGGREISKIALLGLIDSLKSTVEKLDWQPVGTEWADYYQVTNYTDQSFEQKKQLVESMITEIDPASVIDLGANNGLFSRIASEKGIFTVSADVDPSAVEQNYRTVVQHHEKNLLPLLIDLTNPSPGLGWAGSEREAFSQRSRADLILALALIHHLAISNNVPLARVADYFAVLGRWLVIEFVPKSDSQVRKLLASREDIFSQYTKEGFETAFSRHFAIRRIESIGGSERWLYLMERLGG